MSSSRAFASLSSALLARKGGARPAMRSALPALMVATPDHAPADPLADLGWNDMGDTPAPHPDRDRPDEGGDILVAAARLPLLACKPGAAAIVPPTHAPPGRHGGGSPAIDPSGRRPIIRRTTTAAFTLRLDPDRHYRLRVACARHARSAQALVTEAVDRLLDQQPHPDPLAAPHGAWRNA